MQVGTWSSKLRKEHRLRVFQNKVLRSFSELIGNEVIMERKMCVIKNGVLCTVLPILLG
jgi:hypothetical protein